MPPANLRIDRSGQEALRRNLAALARSSLKVGIPDDSPRDGPGRLGNCDLALIQEYGSPARNIPPRPFLIPGIRKGVSENALMIERVTRHGLLGRRGAYLAGLEEIGGTLLAEILDVAILQSDSMAPLAPRTVASRRKRGNFQTRPLDDTGQMLDALTYEVVA